MREERKDEQCIRWRLRVLVRRTRRDRVLNCTVRKKESLVKTQKSDLSTATYNYHLLCIAGATAEDNDMRQKSSLRGNIQVKASN